MDSFLSSLPRTNVLSCSPVAKGAACNPMTLGLGLEQRKGSERGGDGGGEGVGGVDKLAREARPSMYDVALTNSASRTRLGGVATCGGFFFYHPCVLPIEDRRCWLTVGGVL